MLFNVFLFNVFLIKIIHILLYYSVCLFFFACTYGNHWQSIWKYNRNSTGANFHHNRNQELHDPKITVHRFLLRLVEPCHACRRGWARLAPRIWPKRARSSDQDLRVRGAATCVVTLKVDFPSWSMAENQHLRWFETDELMNEFPPLFYIVLYFVECSRTYSRARKDIQLLPLSVWTCCAVIQSRIKTYECIWIVKWMVQNLTVLLGQCINHNVYLYWYLCSFPAWLAQLSWNFRFDRPEPADRIGQWSHVEQAQ